MHVKRRLPNFEACSVALFATMALYGPLPLRAQTAAPPAASVRSSPSTVPTSPRSGTSMPQHGVSDVNTPIPPNQWTPAKLGEAYKKTDANGDGQLNRQEASASPGMLRLFDQIDRNKDGAISSAEFDEALK